jgi:hypothetical protein
MVDALFRGAIARVPTSAEGRKFMRKNTSAPVFHNVVRFRRIYAGRFKGSEGKAAPRSAPSPCLTLAFLLSIPLWSAILVVVFVVASAWPS